MERKCSHGKSKYDEEWNFSCMVILKDVLAATPRSRTVNLVRIRSGAANESRMRFSSTTQDERKACISGESCVVKATPLLQQGKEFEELKRRML